MKKVVEIDLAGRPFSIETGRLAKQAGGAALVTYGDTVVLVTATASKSARDSVDFLPLTVDYQEKAFAALVELEWFVQEQVEEEKTAREVLHKFRLVQDDPSSLLDLDRELGERPPEDG